MFRKISEGNKSRIFNHVIIITLLLSSNLGGSSANGSGNFDAYSGLQPITDSLLSGVGNGNSSADDLLGGGIRKADHHLNYNKSPTTNANATTTGHHQFGNHTRSSITNTGAGGMGGNHNNNNNNNNGGPLLDFKSAFSVLDDKPGSLR